MIDAGMVSIIIKVAGIGLTTKHLGKNLAEMQPTLVKLVSLEARADAQSSQSVLPRTNSMAPIYVVKAANTRP